jgi:hypothetical protein
MESGFSQSTILPASAAAMAISAWLLGVQMSMASMSSRSISFPPIGFHEA